jgi:antitoxin ParD1/3/4
MARIGRRMFSPNRRDNLILAAAASEDRKLSSLRTMLDNSIAKGGEASEEDIDAALEAKAAELAKDGF